MGAVVMHTAKSRADDAIQRERLRSLINSARAKRNAIIAQLPPDDRNMRLQDMPQRRRILEYALIRVDNEIDDLEIRLHWVGR